MGDQAGGSSHQRACLLLGLLFIFSYFFPCSLLLLRASLLVAAKVVFSFKYVFLCDAMDVIDFLP